MYIQKWRRIIQTGIHSDNTQLANTTCEKIMVKYTQNINTNLFLETDLTYRFEINCKYYL